MPLLADAWARLEVQTYYASGEKVLPELVAGGGWVPAPEDAREQDQLRFQLRIRKKQRSMTKALRKHFGRNASYTNVLSIGDGIYEQLAIEEIGFKHAPAKAGDMQLVKTLKLQEEPTCADMVSTLQAVKDFVPAMVACADDLSIDLAEQERSSHFKATANSAAVLAWLQGRVPQASE